MRLNSSEAHRLESEALLRAVEEMQRAHALTGPQEFQDMVSMPVSGGMDTISAPITLDESAMFQNQFQQQNQPQQKFQELSWQLPLQNEQLLLGQSQ